MSKRKKSTQATVKQREDTVHIKYVKAANSWVKTTVNGGVFRQEWSAQKPN